MHKKLAIAVYLALTCGCVIHAYHYFPLLPDKVPSNFDMDGKVVGWTQKDELFYVYLGTIALIGLFFPILGAALRKFPLNTLSLPNREYWLSDERRQQTLDDMLITLTWMGSATLYFIMAAFQSCYDAGLGEDAAAHPLLPSGTTAVILYTVYILGHAIWLVVKFTRVPRSAL